MQLSSPTKPKKPRVNDLHEVLADRKDRKLRPVS